VITLWFLSKESAHNPKKAWQEVNRLLGRGSRREIEVLKTEIGEMTDKQEIVMELAKIFASVVSHRDMYLFFVTFLFCKLLTLSCGCSQHGRAAAFCSY